MELFNYQYSFSICLFRKQQITTAEKQQQYYSQRKLHFFWATVSKNLAYATVNLSISLCGKIFFAV